MVGWACDRFDRKYILILTALIGIVGFGGFGAVSEYPRGAPVFIFSMLSGLHRQLLLLMVGLSQIGSIVTSLGLSTGPYIDNEIRGSVAGAYSLTG